MVQAVLLAGDRGHSRSIGGRSKAFVEIAGKPMVVHVLESLLHTPEVSEVYVVGDAIRLEKVLAEQGCLQLSIAASCPIHIVPQRSSLYENIWHTFLRTLPSGREDPEHAILVVPTDIPLVIPEEISDFIRKALATGGDYVVGLTPEHVLDPYAPTETQDGIEMANFNLREGRFRQNNLHYSRPLKMGNRRYVQDLYENRYQKEFGNTIRLALRVVIREFLNLWVVFFYALIHMASVCDRRGNRRAADWFRKWVPIKRVERGISALLRTDMRIVQTELGGAALDVDNEHDCLVVEKHLGEWKARQARFARTL